MKNIIIIVLTAVTLSSPLLANAYFRGDPPPPTPQTNADSTRELEICLACNGTGKVVETNRSDYDKRFNINNLCYICNGCGKLVTCRIKEMFGYQLLRKIKPPKVFNSQYEQVEIRPNLNKRMKYFNKYYAVVNKEGYIFELKATGSMKTKDDANALLLKYKLDYEKQGFKVIEDNEPPSCKKIEIFDETRRLTLKINDKNLEFNYQFNQMSNNIYNCLEEERLKKAASKL